MESRDHWHLEKIQASGKQIGKMPWKLEEREQTAVGVRLVQFEQKKEKEEG